MASILALAHAIAWEIEHDIDPEHAALLFDDESNASINVAISYGQKKGIIPRYMSPELKESKWLKAFMDAHKWGYS